MKNYTESKQQKIQTNFFFLKHFTSDSNDVRRKQNKTLLTKQTGEDKNKTSRWARLAQ